MSIKPETPLREVAFEVCTALEKSGARAVLTGGSAAQIWAPTEVHSLDLDFVLEFSSSDAVNALRSLGYVREADCYVHPDNRLFLEFPPGPLSIGDELLRQWDTLHEGEHVLHLLSPTDSCRDRLAGYLFWADWGSLTQAAAVARIQSQRVDLELVRNWCERHGYGDKYRELERAIRS